MYFFSIAQTEINNILNQGINVKLNEICFVVLQRLCSRVKLEDKDLLQKINNSKILNLNKRMEK